MAILDRFTKLFRTAQQPVAVINPPQEPTSFASLAQEFSVSRDRGAKIRDCRQMVEDDPRPEVAINTLARDVTKGGFEIQITGGRSAEATTAIQDMIDRLDLFAVIDDWIRLTLRDGDLFLEVGLAADGTIALLTVKPTIGMYRNSNSFDQFTQPERAFFYTDKPFYAEPPADAIWFADWQIIHGRWNSDVEVRYGKPLFSAARTAYKRVKQGELDTSVRRKTRSGIRYVHVLEDASVADLEAYKAANAPALDDPYAAVSDFFMNKRGGITVLQGDANLSDIEDIKHHVQTFAMASPVPIELIGYGTDVNRDILEQKKDQYNQAITAVRGWVRAQFLKPLFERQWLLKGILPVNLKWDLQWKGVEEPASAEMVDAGRFAASVMATGLLSDETLLRLFATMVPDFDVEAELIELEKRQAEKQAEAEAQMQAMAANAQMPPNQPGAGKPNTLPQQSPPVNKKPAPGAPPDKKEAA